MVLEVLVVQIFQIYLKIFWRLWWSGRRGSRKNNNRGSDLRYDLSVSLEEAFQEKNKTYNFQLQKNVTHVKETDQNLVTILIDVPIVVEMEEYVQIKVFLQFNKHVHNVLGVVKKLQILVMIATVKEINNLQKKYLLQFLKV